MTRRYRWLIGGLLFASTVINYLDRQTLSVLAPYLKSDFRWSNQDFALVVISFRVAYAVGQTGSGQLLDRVGTRRGLSLGVGFYSIAAILTSLASGLRSFCWGIPTVAMRPLHRHLRPAVSAGFPPFSRKSPCGPAPQR